MLIFSFFATIKNTIMTCLYRKEKKDILEIFVGSEISRIINHKLKLCKDLSINNSIDKDNTKDVQCFSYTNEETKKNKDAENSYCLYFKDKTIYIDITDLCKEKKKLFFFTIDILDKNGRSFTVDVCPFYYDFIKKEWICKGFCNKKKLNYNPKCSNKDTSSSTKKSRRVLRIVFYGCLTICILYLFYLYFIQFVINY